MAPRLRQGSWWLDLAGMLGGMVVGMAVGHMVEMSAGRPGAEGRLLLMGLWMSAGMTVWMLARRSSVSHLAEMNLAMLLPFGLGAIGVAAGAIDEDPAMSAAHVVMLIAMVALHLFRPMCPRV